jgi:hypothetical protein
MSESVQAARVLLLLMRGLIWLMRRTFLHEVIHSQYWPACCPARSEDNCVWRAGIEGDERCFAKT